jgi:hypothetical protein
MELSLGNLKYRKILESEAKRQQPPEAARCGTDMAQKECYNKFATVMDGCNIAEFFHRRQSLDTLFMGHVNVCGQFPVFQTKFNHCGF